MTRCRSARRQENAKYAKDRKVREIHNNNWHCDDSMVLRIDPWHRAMTKWAA